MEALGEFRSLQSVWNYESSIINYAAIKLDQSFTKRRCTILLQFKQLHVPF